MRAFVRFFSSVKLAITLLIIITLASLIGTLIPQQRSLDEYFARYGQLAHFLQIIQFTKLYQSWWFLALLFLFALNVIVCTLNRLSPKLKRALRPRLEVEAKEVGVLKVKDKLNKNLTLAEAREGLKRELSSRHYRLREREKENRVFLLARKKTLGLFGADVVHLGLLIILAGGITSGLAGFKEYLTFSQGKVLDVSKADFKLRLDKFETEYYANGSVRDWKSTLTVIEKEKPVLSKVVEVNHPLSYKGFVFYQSSYGWDWTNTWLEVLVKKNSDPSFLTLSSTKKTRSHPAPPSLTILPPSSRAGKTIKKYSQAGYFQDFLIFPVFTPSRNWIFPLNSRTLPQASSRSSKRPATQAPASSGSDAAWSCSASSWLFTGRAARSESSWKKDKDRQNSLQAAYLQKVARPLNPNSKRS